LKQCRSVKTVRLVLTLGRELQMPWAKGLEKLHLPTGSKNRWVGRSEDGLLVLEP
ncbi:MAG: type IV toxin-antitoxin system AbiEi family antitoxin domain-containing protein, partial [Burkholderiales bacterium]|nr:type IV toxin-antitoxin system AbiEi family antitoxin domain-containing protein [Burkholderiales bacterium]